MTSPKRAACFTEEDLVELKKRIYFYGELARHDLPNTPINSIANLLARLEAAEKALTTECNCHENDPMGMKVCPETLAKEKWKKSRGL